MFLGKVRIKPWPPIFSNNFLKIIYIYIFFSIIVLINFFGSPGHLIIDLGQA